MNMKTKKIWLTVYFSKSQALVKEMKGQKWKALTHCLLNLPPSEQLICELQTFFGDKFFELQIDANHKSETKYLCKE